MLAILAKKIGMTQIFDKANQALAATLVYLPSTVIVDRKTKDKDGYEAVVIGVKEAKNSNQPLKGLLEKNKITALITKVFEQKDVADLEIGQKISVDQFQVGDKVSAVGITKGKGFAGTVKRHSFSRGPKTHGSDNYRRPGSIGAQQPQRVIKGRKMAGHMGHDQVTIHNLEVVAVDPEKSTLLVSGSLPGPKYSWLKIIKR